MRYAPVSGIYCIRHIESGRRYIGQAVDIQRRDRRHWAELRARYHSNLNLQRAFDKYGKVGFLFETIETCAPELLVSREQYWIDFYGLENLFNILPLAGSVGGRPLPLETREKISKSLTGRKRILSPEALEKMRAGAARGRLSRRKKMSPEALENIRRLAALRPPQIHAEERRKKASEFFKSIPRTPEWCANISKSLKGRKFPKTEKWRVNFLAAMSGRIRSKEERDKRSASLKMAWIKRKARTQCQTI